MTNTELVALLREARKVVLTACAHGSIPYVQWSREQHTAERVLRRIDAALAAHDAVPPSEEKVEWKRQIQFLRFGDKDLTVWAYNDGTWGWELIAPPTKPVEGCCATESEAKAAAIAAARGMK